MPPIIKPLASTRRVLIGLGALIAALVSCGLFLESDVGLMSDESMRHRVETRVFGTALYGETCSAASYQIDFPPYGPSHIATEVFITPVPGREQQCPAFTMIIDRTSGELWRIN